MWELLEALVSSKMWEFLEALDAMVVVPVTQAATQVVISTASNLIFYTIVHEHLPQASYFTPLALVFGFLHLITSASEDLIQFSFITGLVFVVCLHIALFMSYTCQYNYENTLKTVVFCYALCCFRFCKDRDDFSEFVVTFIVMTVKLFCAAEEIEKKPFDERGEHGILIEMFHFWSYLMYTAWVPYKDFLILRNKQHEKSERWWNMMMSAGSRAIIFKVLSHELIQLKAISDFWFKDQIVAIIQAFQYRCKYYYRAQIAELEIIAAGVKKGGWNKHCMFKFELAEFTLKTTDFFKGFNTPLSSFLRHKFSVKNYEGQVSIFIHIVLVLLVLTTYNVNLGSLCLWFVFAVLSQELVFYVIVEVCDTCLLSCTAPFCYHTFGRRHTLFYVFKFVLIVIKQFRLSLMFVNLDTIPFEYSFKWTITALLVDICVAVLLSITQKPRQSYFKHLKNYRKANA